MSSKPEAERIAPTFLDGGGEIGALMRAKDWAATPLGPPEIWPQSLRTVVRILLSSRYQMWMGWGEQLSFFYNDAYAPTLGVKHGHALGQPASEVWKEIWSEIGPRIEHVLEGGEATWDEGLLLFLERSGYPEETYHTFSYSPLADDDGRTVGMLCVVTEETERIIGERRLATLRDLAAAIASTRTQDEIVVATERQLGKNLKDLPFTLVYLFDEAGAAKLVCASGVQEIAPPIIDPSDEEPVWPITQIAQSRVPFTIGGLDRRFGQVPTGDWDKPPREVVVAPIARQGQDNPAGFIVAGLNPYRSLDETYLGFINLVAGQFASGLANVRAYQEERQRAEALAEIDRAKTTFFSNVSHEFRTPLTLMLGPLEDLLNSPVGGNPTEERTLVQLAHRNGVRLLKLVNTLLDFTRIEAGRMQATFEPLDLSRFTAELASNFRSTVEKAGLRLVVDCSSLPQPLYIDRDSWEKIVLNLMSNAFKFTFEGEIAVGIRPSSDGNHAEMTIRDTGTGIPPDDVPHLFERFRRVDGVRGRSIEGSGIGLALVQELVKLHGSTIAVASRVGEGSTFTVSVPFGSAHLPAERIGQVRSGASSVRSQAYIDEVAGWLNDGALDAPDVVAASASGEITDSGPMVKGDQRILLADDNADMRDYVRRLLGESYVVEAVNDGLEALDAARRQRPDLVLTDVMMPRLDGFGLLSALRSDSALRDVPVIFLSARAGEEASVEALQAGADDYLVKPFAARELLARVQAAIRLAKVRREADEVLREESLRVLRLLEQAPSFICVLRGPTHVFEFANAAYRRIVGEREIIGRTVREAIPEAVDQGFMDILDRVYAGERFVGEAMPMVLNSGPDGTPAASFIDFIYEPITGVNGAISGVFVEGYEVTARVRAELALRSSEEQLRLATEAAEVGLWDVDAVTGALYWPARVKAMFGISPDAPATMDDFYAGLHPEDRDATTAAYDAAADPARRALYDVEYRALGKEDGVVRWVAAKGRGVFDSEGRCVRVIGTAIDITRRKADEARLRELNETLERRVSEALAERKLLADIVEGTDAFVQVADLDYRWMAINKAAASEFERIYGQRPRQGGSMLELLADRPEHAAAVKAVWSRALAGEEFTQIDEFGDPGLGRRWYEMKFNALRDQTGRQIGAYQFVYDVTERLRDQARLAEAETALRQAQKLDAMGQLTGGVAHDFNNLLTPILSVLDMLHRRRVGGEREQRLVSAALQSGERAKTLVQRLLAFARRQPLQPGAVDVRSVIENMAELVRSTTGPQIRVILELAADLPPANADANQLEMAILNLSVNARDAMERDGGTLRISANAQAVAPARDSKLPPGRYVRVSVADTGVGMSKDVAAKAVEPFYSTKGVGKGTGLGLSMVHGLALQLGGELVIESEPGQGTTIELWLPQSDQPLVADTTADATKLSAAHHDAGRALLVDDEDLVRSSVADMLTELGYEVVEASSAEEALELLANGRQFDVVITDHLMSGMSGAVLACEMRKRWPWIQTVIISGYAEAEGIDPDLLRLSKPFRQSELAEILIRAATAVSA
jgi:PAS domain S-box-containing protein